ncbi:hypothetical protein SBP02_05655 [Pseudomonas benzenivorans]|uniref:Uncharacterized protein n=1 Tax=Pseudomonas benzenivorans TaxID=556533 RepID=A0ABZ0PYE4_9PSED|nr:hypothetical protein [Pseudomonas benzenivorans]WPC06238.1 hypothetical protein SBP02_05655 [Pseudomonas benzenivorans]
MKVATPPTLAQFDDPARAGIPARRETFPSGQTVFTVLNVPVSADELLMVGKVCDRLSQVFHSDHTSWDERSGGASTGRAC